MARPTTPASLLQSTTMAAVKRHTDERSRELENENMNLRSLVRIQKEALIVDGQWFTREWEEKTVLKAEIAELRTRLATLEHEARKNQCPLCSGEPTDRHNPLCYEHERDRATDERHEVETEEDEDGRTLR